ncbi:MAG: hypothetical protein Q7V05_05175 [Methanoregula sp.]|nr:hypothetical protein [Methanoregula sp.]
MDRGLAKAESSKRKQRQGVKRKHMAAGHIDGHEDAICGLKICVVLDDASRKILVIDEFATWNGRRYIRTQIFDDCFSRAIDTTKN